MPKRSPDACMFCGNLPCTCNAKHSKTSRTKASSDLDRMRERAARRVEKTVRPAVEHHASQEESELSLALIALRPILHATELEKYKGVVGTERANHQLDGRVLAWRRRYSALRLEIALPVVLSLPEKSPED